MRLACAGRAAALEPRLKPGLSDWRLLARLLRGLLPGLGIGCFFVLAFYAQNHANLVLSALWAPLALRAGVTLLVWLPLLWLVRAPAAAAVCALLMFYNGLHGVLLLEIPGCALWRAEAWREPLRPLLALGGVLLAVCACRAARRHPAGAAAAARVAEIMAAALLAVSLLPVAAIEMRRGTPWRRTQPPAAAGAPAIGQAAPTIVHLVLDGYARDDVLRGLYGFDNAPFLAWLEGRGFRVARRARANYCQTALSLASTLNMRYLDEDVAPRRHGGDRAVLARLIRRNRATELLRARGYEIVAYPTGYCVTDALAADLRWPAATLDEFTMACLGRSWIGSLLAGHKATADHLRRFEAIMRTLPAAAAAPRPRYIYAHLGAPHPPFLHDARGARGAAPPFFTLDDGSHLVNPSGLTVAAYRAAYLAQLRYVNERLQAMLDELPRRARRPLVILLHSDHGPGSQWQWDDLAAGDGHERTGILCALRADDGGLDDLRDDLSAVNLLRAILGRYAGCDLPPLPDRVLLSTWRRPYDFLDVTANLKARGSASASDNASVAAPAPRDNVTQRIGMEGGQNSESVCRQAPQGVAGALPPAASASATNRRAPSETAFQSATRSAQTVRP